MNMLTWYEALGIALLIVLGVLIFIFLFLLSTSIWVYIAHKLNVKKVMFTQFYTDDRGHIYSDLHYKFFLEDGHYYRVDDADRLKYRKIE